MRWSYAGVVVAAIMTGWIYRRARPPIWYRLEEFPMMQLLKDFYPQIRKEAMMIMKEEPVFKKHRPQGRWSEGHQGDFAQELKKRNGWVHSWEAGNGGWLNYGLVYYDDILGSKRAPLTCKILEMIGKIRVAGFSWMKTHSKIKTHWDKTGYIYGSLALHVGLLCPEEGAYLEVHGEEVKQENGKVIVFDSTYWHSARNDSNQDRVVLYIDFILQ